MLADLERHREVEPAEFQTVQRLIEIPGNKARWVDRQPVAVNVIAVDADDAVHAVPGKYAQPQRGAAADIDDRTGRDDIQHMRNGSRGGIEAGSFRIFIAAGARSVGTAEHHWLRLALLAKLSNPGSVHSRPWRSAAAAANGPMTKLARVSAQRIMNGVPNGIGPTTAALEAATPKIRTGTVSGSTSTASNSPPRRKVTE